MAGMVARLTETVSWLLLQHPFLTIIGSYLLYHVFLAIYHVYLSPLSQFPGPRIAAATLLYEFYYDFIAKGQYTFRIAQLHEEYGPIVRISPYEVHISDADFYDSLYTGSVNPREKWGWGARVFGVKSAYIGTISHELHRKRRAPLNHFFSKRSVLALEPMLQEMVEKLCARLDGFKQSGKAVNMRNATAALTMDVITRYAFGKAYDALEDEGFAPNWSTAIESIGKVGYLNVYFPLATEIMKRLPVGVSKWLSPETASIMDLQMVLAKDIEVIMNEDAEGGLKECDHPTIFHEFLRSDELPVGDRNATHFLEEAQTLIGAGQVTTAHDLHVTCWHILSTPGVLEKLRAELREAMPDASKLAPLQQLEELPYLSSVIMEGLRFSHGVVHRLTRISPKDPVHFRDWTIPAGTPMSMTHMLIHQDKSIYEDPLTFQPERWSGPDSARLRKYLIPFSKGTRSCLGMHLAQAEVRMTIAALFRRFEFEMGEMEREDIDFAHDYFIPIRKQGARELEVFIK